MPRGYHVYSCDEFDLPDGWQSPTGDVVVGEPEELRGILTLAHPVSYFQPKNQRIRVGGIEEWTFYNRFDRQLDGMIWLSDEYAFLEVTEPPVHTIGRVLGAQDGVDWNRLVIPDLKRADARLPSKTGRGLEDPANPNRRNVWHFGDDVARDRTNSEELEHSHLNFVQFGQSGQTARAFDSATLLLYGYYDVPEEAAADAALLWDTYLAQHAAAWTHGWRKRRRL